MSWLVRLYPTAWRRRYEPELVDMLEQRPMTPVQAIDLIRGAVDAHLHPMVAGSAPQPWTHRLPGLLATSAGLIWSSSFLLAFSSAADQEIGDGPGIAAMIMFLSVPGDYVAGYGRRIGGGIGMVAAGILLAWTLPWTLSDGLLNAAAGGGAYLLLGAGMLVLVAIRAGTSRMVRWIVVTGAVFGPATLAIPVLMGLFPVSPPAVMMLAVVLPYGIAWTIIGVRMMVRGVATLADVPDTAVAQEVSAA